MQELKPVAWIRLGGLTALNRGEVIPCAPVKRSASHRPLYALPATHRIVPVELLQRVIEVAAWDDHNTIQMLQAIIDKEPT